MSRFVPEWSFFPLKYGMIPENKHFVIKYCHETNPTN